jgi:two-component system response regulator DesR
LIRVLLWNRCNLVSKALASVLAQEDDLTVVAESCDAERVFELALRERPHVAVLDHALGSTSPLADVCVQLLCALPEIHILVLLDRLLGARIGADLAKLVPGVGLIETSCSPTELGQCIRRLTQGQPVLDIDLAVAALKADRNPLTDREREVLRLALNGDPISEIAATLFLSAGTVRNYLSHVMAKTGARTRIEAIRIAEKAGWI